jgi:beta-glucosidase-like glycosyl hydrolase
VRLDIGCVFSRNLANLLNSFFGSDVIHGAGFLEDSTLFPHVIGMAATFNTTFAFDVARVIALGSSARRI